jgi:hypothetical protein
MMQSFSDILFNLAHSESIVQNSALKHLFRIPLEHLRLFYKANILEAIDNKNNKYQVRCVWSLSRLGMLTKDLTDRIEEIIEWDAEENGSTILKSMNLKDYQSILEGYANIYKDITYNSIFLDKITLNLRAQFQEPKVKSSIDNNTLTSLFKSYKNLRYDNHDIWGFLTDQAILQINNKKADEQLIFFAC